MFALIHDKYLKKSSVYTPEGANSFLEGKIGEGVSYLHNRRGIGVRVPLCLGHNK